MAFEEATASFKQYGTRDARKRDILDQLRASGAQDTLHAVLGAQQRYKQSRGRFPLRRSLHAVPTRICFVTVAISWTYWCSTILNTLLLLGARWNTSSVRPHGQGL